MARLQKVKKGEQFDKSKEEKKTLKLFGQSTFCLLSLFFIFLVWQFSSSPRKFFTYALSSFHLLLDSSNSREMDMSRTVPVITSWRKGELLGRGSFGSVYEGISGDGDFFAVKEVSLLDQGSKAQESIQQLEGEIALLSQLQHQNIVRYRGTAKDGSILYIFLELVSQGSLLKLYQRYQLGDSQVSLYTRQILDGLHYLHDKGFIHREIKCANILVDTSGVVKLADFGLAKVSKIDNIKSCKGTPFWMAPEVISLMLYDGYGKRADIWSLGCTVLEMLTRQIPYSHLEPVQALFQIGRGNLPSLPDTLSPDARDFIIKCLKVNPLERPTAAELLNHPFVRRPLSSTGSGIVKSKGYLVPIAVCGGIKGVGPPVLNPPPAMDQPPTDIEISSWDFIENFGPTSGTAKRPSSSSSSSRNGCDEEEAWEVEREEMSIITSWQKGELLGRGSFGSVYEGISGDGDFFAVKEISLLEVQEGIHQLEREIALLSQLQHQNIVRYRGTAKDGSNLYIFLELVSEGSLLKLYQMYQLRDSQVSLYTRQILDGLHYLHDKGFIHRDLNCANVLIDASGVVKLADFGLAKVSRLNDIKACKGTPFWMAPEVINRRRNDGYERPADIWSLGCTVLEMLTRQIPYSDCESVQALFHIAEGKLPSLPDTLSPDSRDFILSCLKHNPRERPTAAELLNHPFVRRPLPSTISYSGLRSD